MKSISTRLVLDAGQAEAPAVPYPENYRQWQHVKTMVIEPGHALYGAFGGIHHLQQLSTLAAHPAQG